MDGESLGPALLSRQADNKDAGEELLELLKNPFADQLQGASMLSALATSLAFTAIATIFFSFLRPYHQALYAPRSKHADDKHAPPPIGKQPWAWFTPLWKTNEKNLIPLIGMDATIFLRFVRMCRNLFLVLSLVAILILVPVNMTSYEKDVAKDTNWFNTITPEYVWGTANWAQVAVAWLFNTITAAFLWWNYRRITELRRSYFESDEYQNSLHARTLMLTDIPKQGCSDEGIARIIDEVVPNSSFARTAVARNVKDLPELISQHDHAVRKLEKILAKYLKNPQQLPPGRPLCRPSKKDRAYGTYPPKQKIDAIEYYTARIRQLEVEIKEVRASVDKRGSMPYGFASYTDIVEAHNIAYACRNKKPHGTSITLAPRPNDIIWVNMPLSKSARSRRRWVNTLWITLLTIVWIGPNAMIAIFLINLGNLGNFWDDFQTSLQNNTTMWGIIQGILSPAIMSLVYLVLPMIFRRLSHRAGDRTKTGRERHVLGKLFSFFVFNNLIVFTMFSVVWTFVAGLKDSLDDGVEVWSAILKQNIGNAIFTALCRNSPFWVTYLLQRQLGAAVDLAQVWPLIVAFFTKKFSSPTPREIIEVTAPPPFEYASYYNYFLFYVTITLCYAGIQPLVLPATAMYFGIDYYLKKYLLLYRFVTKTESGGVFWRVLFNRFIFAVVLSNLVVLLILWNRGDGQMYQFFAVCPLPVLMVCFKFYCRSAFDMRARFYSTRNVSKHPEAGQQKEDRQRSERLASRFGHPALYKQLITPMVHQRAQNLLPSIYHGRLTEGRSGEADDLMSVSGYSDTYAMKNMLANNPGKSAGGMPGFEFVSESNMDFEYYKNRAEFAEDHGGGEIYGRPGEIFRPNTPGSFGDGSDMMSRPGTPLSGRSTPFAPGAMSRTNTGLSETGYQSYRPSPSRAFTPQAPLMEQDHMMMGGSTPSPFYAHENSSSSGLVRNAQDPSMSPVPMDGRGMSPSGRSASGARSHSPGPSMGALGGGPHGYSNLAQTEYPDGGQDPAQYDYFRSGAARRSQGW